MSQTVSATNPLGTEKISKLMVRYAVPTIIALVVNSLYNMVDQIFIGNGVGYLGTAATNVILPLMTVTLLVNRTKRVIDEHGINPAEAEKIHGRR